jgi:FkbM family methyltransferase
LLILKNWIFNVYRNHIPNFRGKIRIGKIVRNFLSYHPNFQDPIKARDGVNYFLPSLNDQIGIELFFHGIYEKDIIDFLVNNIQDDDVFFDIGSNIGSIGIPIARTRKITYFGFEASPNVYSYLKRNFDINIDYAVSLVNKAVADNDDKQLNFVDCSYDRYGEGHLTFEKSDLNTISVDTISLDKFCKESKISQIDWLKIDVQGHESLVFLGAERLLQEGRIKNILFEFEEWAESDAGYEIGLAKKMIEAYGYRLQNLRGENWSILDESNSTMIWATI